MNGKGSRQRTLPLPGDVRRILTAWLAARPALGEYLFPGRYGNALDTSSIRRLVDKYEHLSGVVGVSPHVLRHTTLTELVRRKKQDLALVAAVAGHAKLATTAIYVQPNMQDLEAAVDSLVEDEGTAGPPAVPHLFGRACPSPRFYPLRAQRSRTVRHQLEKITECSR
ncbi:tyrosine-type recombinase/integrase [Cystobacter fuscus]